MVIGAREPEGKEKKNEAGNFVIAWIAARTDSTSKCHTRAHSAVREGGSEVCSSAASKKGKCPQSTTYMKKNEKKKLAAFVFPRLTPVLYCLRHKACLGFIWEEVDFIEMTSIPSSFFPDDYKPVTTKSLDSRLSFQRDLPTS